jgi:hypothetical protein
VFAAHPAAAAALLGAQLHVPWLQSGVVWLIDRSRRRRGHGHRYLGQDNRYGHSNMTLE